MSSGLDGDARVAAGPGTWPGLGDARAAMTACNPSPYPPSPGRPAGGCPGTRADSATPVLPHLAGPRPRPQPARRDTAGRARELTSLGRPRAAGTWPRLRTRPRPARGIAGGGSPGAGCRLGDPRAADTWYDLAYDPGLEDFTRGEAAKGLADLGDPRAADTWHALAQRPGLPSGTRARAARELAELGDPARPAHGVCLAGDPGLAGDSRAYCGSRSWPGLAALTAVWAGPGDAAERSPAGLTVTAAAPLMQADARDRLLARRQWWRGMWPGPSWACSPQRTGR